MHLSTADQIGAVSALAAVAGSLVLFLTNLQKVSRVLRAALRAANPLAGQRKRHEEILEAHKEILKSHEEIMGELRPNGGNSLRDAVNTIDDKVTALAGEQAVMKGRQQQTAAQVTLLLDGSKTLGWISDAEGKQTWASSALVELTGWEADELLGWGWVNVIYGPDQERIMKAWSAAIVQRRIFDEDCIFQTRDRRLFEGHLNARPFPGDGKPTRWVGTVTLLRELVRQPRKRRPTAKQVVDSIHDGQ